MLNHSIVFLAGAILLAPVISTNRCLATDPQPSDNTICSIVVPATTALLLPFDGGFHREHQERIIAVCAESVAGSYCGAAPDQRAYPYLDVSRLSDGQTAAMLRTPSKMMAWLKREDNRRLGDLPLRLIEAQGRRNRTH